MDYVPSPPTSFPHRDLLVLEQLPLGPGERVCEVGVGGGETAARIARLGVDEITGVDVSEPAVEGLRDLERRTPNLHVRVLDVTRPGAVGPLAGRFSSVLSCDTLEHVPEPEAYFRAIADLLAPGGRFLITFPNEPAEVMHGITRFDDPAEIAALAAKAGLEDVQIGAAELAPHAARVASALGWRPLRLVRGALGVVRRMRGAARSETAQEPPQTFEATQFHKNRELWRRLSPAVNLYWYGVLRLMTARGPAFELDWDFRDTPFSHCQVVVVGGKGSGPDR